MTKMSYQTAALHALQHLTVANDATPLRSVIGHAINLDDLQDPTEFTRAIDYCMHYIATAASQVHSSFVPSTTTVAELVGACRPWSFVKIRNYAITSMATYMPPSLTDRRLAKLALEAISHQLRMINPGQLRELESLTLATLFSRELTLPRYHDKDHIFCVRRAIRTAMIRAADSTVTFEQFVTDIAPLTSMPALLDRAAATIDTTCP